MLGLSTKIEIMPPDISAYKHGNVNIDYVHHFKSGKAGPNITITAIVHGNELCGAIALDILLKSDLRPRKGSLTLCFCNVTAYQSFDTAHPYISRFIDEDFNRIWSDDALKATRSSLELSRAKEILPIIEQTDILLDLHSMSSDCPPLSLAGTTRKGLELAQNLNYPEHIVIDPGHGAGARLRDFAPFIMPENNKNALLVECGQHWLHSSADVALQTSLRFLKIFDMISDDDFAKFSNMNLMIKDQKVLNVTEAITAETENFQFSHQYTGLDKLTQKGTIIGLDGKKAILTPYDDCYLIMPTHGVGKGQTAVRFAKSKKNK